MPMPPESPPSMPTGPVVGLKPVSSGGNRLEPGQYLQAGQQLAVGTTPDEPDFVVGIDEKTFLTVRNDPPPPNSDKYDFAKGLVSVLLTNGATVTKLGLRKDGHLVLFDERQDMPAWWSPEGSSTSRRKLVLEDDGHLCLYSSGLMQWGIPFNVPVNVDPSRKISTLKMGQFLLVGQRMEKDDTSLSLTEGGAICIEQNKKTKTYYYTGGGIAKARFLQLTLTGRLAVFDTTGKPLWTSPAIIDETDVAVSFLTAPAFTLASSGAAVEVVSAVRGGGGKTETRPGWSTAAALSGSRLGVPSALPAGQLLKAGDLLLSPNGFHYLTMEETGNLALYRAGRKKDGARWESESRAASGYAVLAPSGVLSVFAGDGKSTVWKKGAAGKESKDAVLEVQSDGDVVAKAGGVGIWSLGTAVKG